MLLPILLIGGGLVVLYHVIFDDDEGGPLPQHEPDYDPTPMDAGALAQMMLQSGAAGAVGGQAKTGYKKIDAMLEDLRQASTQTGIPLGLLVGWIAKESGGRIDELPKPLKGETDGERGYFQLTPSESRSIGVDHQRLSTDHAYSIESGLKLIRDKYMPRADALGVAAHGSPYYWMLVKLGHTMGSGATKIIVDGAKKAGEAGSWEALEQHALSNDAKYKSATKHSPKKWFPLVDSVRRIGSPFGFGSEGGTLVAGEIGKPAFTDIPDVLKLIRKKGGR